MLSDHPALRLARQLLLVEDEPLVQELIVTVLEDAGLTIAVANDGLQAINPLEADAKQFCGLITDINLGQGADGWEVARKARAQVFDLPVIYISGLSGHEWTANGVPHSLMITKPFNPAEIVAAMSSLLLAADIIS